MDDTARAILAALDRVDAQRRLRLADPVLARSVVAVKRYQHRRFAATYSDFLLDPSTSPASQFFLDELYGPVDFSMRDEQFRRIVPGLSRLFPREVAATVLDLSQLHALSEELDGAMAEANSGREISAEGYGLLWRKVGRPQSREDQIRLMLGIGGSIEHLAQQVLLRTGLKLMRGPATAAGFGSLQGFLERGLAAFRTLRKPVVFLETIAARERQLAVALFTEPGQAS